MSDMNDMICRVAREVRFYFEIRTRENGEQFTALRDEAPDWCREVVRLAFGGRLPDDRRYKMIASAIGAIADGWATDESHYEWCDSQVDIYHADRAMWLASDIWREIYCDLALDAGIIDETAGIFARLGAGQYMEAREIFGILWSALRERADEISRMVENESVYGPHYDHRYEMIAAVAAAKTHDDLRQALERAEMMEKCMSEQRDSDHREISRALSAAIDFAVKKHGFANRFDMMRVLFCS